MDSWWYQCGCTTPLWVCVVCLCMYWFAYMCFHVCMYAYTNTYAHTFMHTCIQTMWNCTCMHLSVCLPSSMCGCIKNRFGVSFITLYRTKFLWIKLMKFRPSHENFIRRIIFFVMRSVFILFSMYFPVWGFLKSTLIRAPWINFLGELIHNHIKLDYWMSSQFMLSK